ncbi:hypothetical protein TKK_0001038 [Trichogramma kaykai]
MAITESNNNNIEMSGQKAFSLPEYWIPSDLKSILTANLQLYPGITERGEQYQNILSKLTKIKTLSLSKSHYQQFLKLALYLEEYEYVKSMKKYSLHNQSIVRSRTNSKEYTLVIENLQQDKDHPVHKSINLIEVFNSKDFTKKKFVLKIKSVKDDRLTILGYPEFCDSYQHSNRYNICFKPNTYTFRCSHYAISLINPIQLSNVLFPIKRDIARNCEQLKADRWFNEAARSNREQRDAVNHILDKSAYPAAYLIYGPPGTGKTLTLVEAISQICHKSQENVLICTPSNSAGDVIAKRLLDYIPAPWIDRIYSKSRPSCLIDESIKKCSNCDERGHVTSIDKRALVKKRIVVTTLCTSVKLLLMNLNAQYGYVFIDEAGQATETECMIALNVANLHSNGKCQIVLSGDPRQLGPSIRSKYAQPILGRSMMDRLMSMEPYAKQQQLHDTYDPRYITKLVRNYRSHPDIIKIPNELYYDNELVACGDYGAIEADSIFPQDFPIAFHAVLGREQTEPNSTSPYNDREIECVVRCASSMIGKRIGSKLIAAADIGVITPFSAQSNRIQTALKQIPDLANLAVGTVEIFQGQEKDVVIISTVRSRVFHATDGDHIGFLSNPRRFNVAITRAKSALVVIGNPAVLAVHPDWRRFILYVDENRGLCGETSNYSSTKNHLDNQKAVDQNNNDDDKRSDFPNKHNFDDTKNVTITHAKDQNNNVLINEKPETTQVLSNDLFDENLDIVKIHDGIVRSTRNKYLFNGKYYTERQCCIL